MPTKTKLQGYSKNSLAKTVNSLSLSTGKSKSLDSIFTSDEPSLALIRKDHGSDVMKALITLMLTKTLNLIGAELTDEQIEYIIEDVIIPDYYAYTVSDFNIIVKDLMRKKVYGKITVQDMIIAIDEYSYNRDEYAVSSRSKESANIKAIPVTNDKIKDAYKKMKSGDYTPPVKENNFRDEQRKAQSRYLTSKHKEHDKDHTS